MPRRLAVDRFTDVYPSQGKPLSEAVADEISALSNARRRQLLDVLSIHGPSSVGKLATATHMAAGSASHHLRVLARAGLVEPAPECAGDTRESWWRISRRCARWSTNLFAEGTAGEQLTRVGTTANLDYLIASIRRWDAAGPQLGWEGTVIDALVRATPDDLALLSNDLEKLFTRFVHHCRRSERAFPQVPRRAVRLMALTFPEVALDG